MVTFLGYVYNEDFELNNMKLSVIYSCRVYVDVVEATSTVQPRQLIFYSKHQNGSHKIISCVQNN